MRLQTKNLIYIVSAWVLSAMFSFAHAGGEDALYEPDAPAGSAYVRVFNAQPEISVDEANLGGKTPDSVPSMAASDYLFLANGNYVLATEYGALDANLEADTFYTLVVTGEHQLKLIEDGKAAGKRKALLSFYNLSDESELSLKTSNGKIAVFENVKQQDAEEREINPVKISLATFAGDKKIAESDAISLERGQAFSLFACGSAENPRLVLVRNNINTNI